MGDGASKRQPTAFISHHSSQVETARRLKVILSHHGITGWLAPDDIHPGQPFDKAIVDQVRQSDLIILLFCEQSDQSRHVKRELMMAEDADKLIFPVRLEDKAADGLAYWLNDYQWIDWFDGEDDTITRMIETIKGQAEDQAPAAAAGAAPSPRPPASPVAEAPPVAPPPASGSQWPVPIASAVIVALIMLVGFYFMTRDDDAEAPVETAAAEGTATGEDASANNDTNMPDPAPATAPPPMPEPSTTPPPALPSAGSGDFYVVVGSFQPGDPSASQRASDFEACSGIPPIVAPSYDYAGFAPGLIVVMAGGYADARQANTVLSRAQSCVVDAFIRQAR